MDLSRETFSNRHYSGVCKPPNLPNYFKGFSAYEEFDSINSSVFPSRSFIEETITSLKERRAKRHRLLEHLTGRLWLEDLPGNGERDVRAEIA